MTLKSNTPIGNEVATQQNLTAISGEAEQTLQSLGTNATEGEAFPVARQLGAETNRGEQALAGTQKLSIRPFKTSGFIIIVRSRNGSISAAPSSARDANT